MLPRERWAYRRTLFQPLRAESGRKRIKPGPVLHILPFPVLETRGALFGGRLLPTEQFRQLPSGLRRAHEDLTHQKGVDTVFT